MVIVSQRNIVRLLTLEVRDGFIINANYIATIGAEKSAACICFNVVTEVAMPGTY